MDDVSVMCAGVVVVGDVLRLCAVGANKDHWHRTVTATHRTTLRKPALFTQQV